ncbi:Capsule polysaccharide export protein-like type [Roseibacterium elongatum DSM 19469]|uniref:Capsule polysaccharide export protein-like type n=1 Tax=Roseicyclus elongatus DSM 19469 TaxID=1294273 RepID=W8RPA6_9RHOB|nr:capsule biosynthesis protein [Roseibacterium elongatum]AHM02969.1 Capsule polysaccharide export protein-like type [Roseibacterium elongatum DSM 19469]
MTTKPKARKFRIRRSDGLGSSDLGRGTIDDGAVAADVRPEAAGAAPAAAPAILEPTRRRVEDGFGDAPFPGSAAHDRQQQATQRQAPPQPAGTPSVEQELAAIRAEGLTGRQLRMARRTAQKHGLSPSSDFDAVRLLRARGIDPFTRSTMLELVVDESAKQAQQGGGGRGADSGALVTMDGGGARNLPAQARQTQPARQPAATPPGRLPPMSEDERANEIMRVQRDIARRRRKRLVLLATRLAFFVLLPTLLVAYYYYRVATPLYATNTEFVIQKAESGGTGGGLGSLLGGSSFATVQESITVQAYLESREAMLRLEEELGFRAHFSAPDIDPLTRIPEDASVEDVYSVYRRHLQIGYDPTEGLVRMEVAAADPQVSQAFSEALIRYAEERVDQMSQRLREDQMAGARESYEDAEARVIDAQARVLELQERRGVLNTEAEVSTVFGQISSFEMQLQEERLRLDEMLSVTRPNQTRVEVAERNIARLEALIEDLRAGLTEASDGSASLARIQSELLIAQADLETRQMMLAQALQQMETSRLEANRQSLYLSMGVYPIPPDAPAYPRAFENTLLALLIFSGIYLMVSMTVSVLREQVSS